MHDCDVCQHIQIKCLYYGEMWQQCLVLCHESISAFLKNASTSDGFFHLNQFSS